MSVGVRRFSIPNVEPLDVGSKRGEATIDEEKKGALCAVRRELRQLAQLSWPVVLTQCLYYTIAAVAIIFAGHRGKAELDVVAVSTGVLNITASPVANGLAGYCDTLFSQVYGSKDRKRLGAVLQKCLLIISVGICPCLAVHINLQALLQLIGYDYTLARLAEQYLLIHIPGTIALYFYIVLAKYVQNQNREVPILIIAAIGNSVNVVLHSVFFVWLGTGVWGSAVSLCMTYVTLLTSTIIYIMVSGIYKDTWQGWTCRSFLSWAQYCKLGIFTLLQYLGECWAFESGIILSGLLGPNMIAAQSIVLKTVAILYAIPWGIGIAGGIRVGQHLGADDPKTAKLSARVTLGTAATLGFFFCVLVVSLRYYLPLIYTNDKDVIDLVASVMPIAGVLIIFDYLGGAMNSILRGSGRQGTGIAFGIPSMIFVLVCGLTLMFKTSLNIKGFWLAVMCAIIFQASVGTIFVIRLNWKDEAAKAQIRVKTSGGPLEHVVTPVVVVATLGVVNPAFNSEDKGLENGMTGVVTTPPQASTRKVSIVAIEDEEAPARFTKKVVFYRTITFGLSFGCLIAAIIIRNTVHNTDPGAGDIALPRLNETTTVAYDGTLEMDILTTLSHLYNGTVF